jgi:hypothetical protein
MAQETELKAGFFQDDGRGTDARTGVVLVPLTGRRGFVFALSRLDKKYSNELRQINQAIEEESRALAQALAKKSSPQHNFENYLADLNARLDAERRQGFWDMRAREYHGVVGLACDSEMYLSGTGDLSILFLHRVTPEQYKIFNLTNNIKAENAVPVWHKIFAVVLDGSLAEGDVFCAASRELKTAWASDLLNQTLTALPPTGAAAKIRQQFPPEAAFAAIVLQMRPPGTADESEILTPRADRSLKELDATQTRTSEWLEDQNPGGLIAQLASWPAKAWSAWQRRQPAVQAWLTTKTKTLGKKILGWLLLRWLRGKFHLGNSGARRAEERREDERQKEAAAERRQRRGISAKLIALAALGILAALAVSIYFLSKVQARQAETDAYQTVVERIEDRLEQGAAALIYKDNERAGRFYAEAETALATLPTNTPVRAAKAANYREQIALANDTIRHIVRILEPAKVASLPSGVSGAALAASQGRFFVFGQDKKAYELDMVGKTLKLVETSDGAVGIVEAAAGADKMIYFLDDRPGISTFDPTAKQLQVAKLAPESGQVWRDITYYGDKLYVLVASGEGQIMRYAPSGTDFGAGSAWIKSKSVTFDDAASFSIDGTIFVLKNNGQIIRFASGSEVGWTFESAAPPLVAAEKIWTDADSAFVYVLDRGNQRLIIYHKDNGRIAVQNILPTLTITGFIVDEKNRTILLLAGESVYSLSADHLP